MLITHSETGQSADVSLETFELVYKIRGWEADSPAELVAADPEDHTVAEVLANVDGDTERAAAALEAEKAGKNRTTLVAQLERIVSPAHTSTEEPTS